MAIKNKPELLSPAGSMESLKAAVNNGCDAVYLGGKDFNARSSAENFSLEEINMACDYCHLRGVKVYVTVNTIYKDSELDKLLKYVINLYEIGVDALILQDLGAVKIIKSAIPNMKIHGSTQMTANSLEDVNYLKNLGVSKIVLSRELGLTEIAEITKNTDVEIETFVHGALCVSYSGQCIMSSMLGGRSGNRGKCAQTCRLPYTIYEGANPMKEGHLLSPKDMQTVTILPELIECGITSFKIEGRMKNPEYVAGTTGIYRKYIDLYFHNPDNYKVDKEDIKILTQLFNRGGFSEGYYLDGDDLGENMISIERPKSWGLQIGFVDNYVAKINRMTIRTREPLLAGDGIEVWTTDSPHVGTSISKPSKAGEIITVNLEGNIQKNDPVYRTYGKGIIDDLRRTWEKDRRKMEIEGSVTAKIGQPLTLQLWDNSGNIAFAKGKNVDKAQNRPLTKEVLSEKIKKTGSTPFILDNLTVDIDEDIFIGISDINELRRECCEILEKTIIKNSKRYNKEKGGNYDENKNDEKGSQSFNEQNGATSFENENWEESSENSSKNSGEENSQEVSRAEYIINKEVHVLVQELYQLEAIADIKNLTAIYFEVFEDGEKHLNTAISVCKENNVDLYVALPRVSRQWRKDIDNDWIEKLTGYDNEEVKGFLVRTMGQYNLVKNSNKKIVIDSSFNIMNKEAVDFFSKDSNVDTVCLSVEANLQEINTMGNSKCQMVVYGYLPLMKTTQCPIGNFIGEKKTRFYCNRKDSGKLYFLKDRKGMKFPLMPDCKNCYCSILNSQPLFTLKFYNEILESTTGSVRLDFTKEGAGKVRRITESYCEMTKENPEVTANTLKLLEEMQDKGNTKGHFFRGVE